MIIIRQATVTDADGLRNLCIETFYHTWINTNSEIDMQTYMGEFFSLEKIKDELSNNGIIYLVACNENKLIGYCKLNRNYAEGNLESMRPIELQRMYVLEELSRSGIGKLLMNKIFEMARLENFEVIWLGVWEKNERAINFYQSFGFEFYGSHQFVLGEDITTDLLMKKLL